MQYIAIIIFLTVLVAAGVYIYYLKSRYPEMGLAEAIIKGVQADTPGILQVALLAVTLMEAGVAATVLGIDGRPEVNPVIKILLHIMISLLQYFMALAVGHCLYLLVRRAAEAQYSLAFIELMKAIVATALMLFCPWANLYVTANTLGQVPVLDLTIYAATHSDIEIYNKARNMGFEDDNISPVAMLLPPLFQMVCTVGIHILISIFQSLHSFSLKSKTDKIPGGAPETTTEEERDEKWKELEDLVTDVLTFYFGAKEAAKDAIKETMELLISSGEEGGVDFTPAQISLGRLSADIKGFNSNTSDRDKLGMKRKVFDLFTKGTDGGRHFGILLPTVEEIEEGEA